MARFKPSVEERQNKAKEQYKCSIIDKNTVCKIVKEALDEKNIKGKILKINPQESDYKKVTEDSSHIIFIQFTASGHIAVVGAGRDISFSKNESRGTWKIISAIEGAEWDDKEVIVIPIQNIKNYRIKKGENILSYRNGVEQYLGDYLLSKEIPILNYFQHKNYSDRFWEKCKKNGYII